MSFIIPAVDKICFHRAIVLDETPSSRAAVELGIEIVLALSLPFSMRVTIQRIKYPMPSQAMKPFGRASLIRVARMRQKSDTILFI